MAASEVLFLVNILQKKNGAQIDYLGAVLLLNDFLLSCTVRKLV